MHKIFMLSLLLLASCKIDSMHLKLKSNKNLSRLNIVSKRNNLVNNRLIKTNKQENFRVSPNLSRLIIQSSVRQKITNR